jgi:hypothetical protein
MTTERHPGRADYNPETMATQVGMGMVHHDRREREQAIECFANADSFQFQHVSEETAREASVAYVDALWEKDAIEDSCRDADGELNRDELANADWSPVQRAFERRATAVGIDPEYADLSTVAWRRHKVGGDYWTPFQKAQMYELRAALQDPDYPHKPRDGQSGFGPEAVRYVLGVELHDMRRFEEGVNAMAPYFERVAQGHQNQNQEEWSV